MKSARLALLLASAVMVAGALSGCRTGIKVEAERHKVRAEDGFSLLTYRLHPANERRGTASDKRRMIVFYLQGSSNASTLRNTEFLAGFTLMDADVILLERRGVSSEGVDEALARRFATRDQRIKDALTTLEFYLEPRAPGTPVVLIGGSEGGDVAAAVAARCTAVTHLILVGSGGGWRQADELRHLVKTHPGYLGIESVEELEEAFRRIRANPDAGDQWLGHPYRRWSSYLWSPIAGELKQRTLPVLVLHGDADRSVPVESARSLVKQLRDAGNEQVRYIEYAGLDHTFSDVRTDRIAWPKLEVDVVQWFAAEKLIPDSFAQQLAKRVRENHPELFQKAAAEE